MPFRKFAHRSRKQDMMLLSGWLFADLLLGLMVIFMAAIPARDPVLPIILVDPTVLSPTNTHCQDEANTYVCQVTLTEDSKSEKPVKWTATSDMTDSDNTVQFSPATGSLKPGQSIVITISHFPCQDGSFTFNATPNELNSILPAVTTWQCKPTQVKLEANPQTFTINNVDVQGLLSNSPQVIEYIKTQLRNEPLLQNRSVGLAIVYGGTEPDNDQIRAEHIAGAIYNIMGSMKDDPIFTAFQKASYYTDLFYLGRDSSIVTIDVYLFQQ